MREIRTSGLTSGEGRRSCLRRSPRPSSTLPDGYSPRALGRDRCDGRALLRGEGPHVRREDDQQGARREGNVGGRGSRARVSAAGHKERAAGAAIGSGPRAGGGARLGRPPPKGGGG